MLVGRKDVATPREVISILVQCAWCQKDMGEKEPLDDLSITHGICPECSAKAMAENEVQK